MKKTIDAESIKKESPVQNVYDVISACLFFGLIILGIVFLIKLFYDFFL